MNLYAITIQKHYYFLIKIYKFLASHTSKLENQPETPNCMVNHIETENLNEQRITNEGIYPRDINPRDKTPRAPIPTE